MKLTTVLVSIGLLLACTVQAQPNTRLDGIWIGTEIVTPQQVSWDPKAPKPKPQSTQISIAIAQGGTLVGIIGGICPGRFEHVWWTGNTLNFDAHNCKRNVSLSPDGKTLIEHGSGSQVTGHWGRSDAPAGYGNFEIFGRFHRQ